MLPEVKSVQTSCFKKINDDSRDDAELISNAAKKAKIAFFIAHKSVKLKGQF